MSAFSYVSVLASVVAGLALVDILVSFNRLIRAGRRVRWHWAAPLSAVLVMLTVIQIWWRFYEPGGGPVTILEFLPQLVELVILFLLAAAALPDEIPADGLDLADYYDRNGRYFWTLFATALGWLLLLQTLGMIRSGTSLSGLVEGRIVDFAILGVFVSLIFIRRHAWHATAFLILSIGPVAWLSHSLG